MPSKTLIPQQQKKKTKKNSPTEVPGLSAGDGRALLETSIIHNDVNIPDSEGEESLSRYTAGIRSHLHPSFHYMPPPNPKQVRLNKHELWLAYAAPLQHITIISGNYDCDEWLLRFSDETMIRRRFFVDWPSPELVHSERPQRPHGTR